MLDLDRIFRSSGSAGTRAVLIIVILIVSSLYLLPFYYPDNSIQFYTDDFYFYLEIADNFIEKNISTFDGETPTNGYHPLWFVLITGLRAIFHGSELAFFIAFALLRFGLSLWVLYLTYTFALKITKQNLLSVFLATYATFFAASLSVSGMEVALAIPLFFFFLIMAYENSDDLDRFTTTMKLGFAGSFLVLARLDTAIFILMFLISPLFLSYGSARRSFTRLLGFGIGGILVPVYLLSNLVFFDTLMPISGQGKQLLHEFQFSLNTFGSIFSLKPGLWGGKIAFTFPAVLISVIGFVVAFLNRDVYLKGRREILLLLPVLFMFSYYITLSFLSSWGIWPWYFYPFVVSFFCSVLIVHERVQSGHYGKARILFARSAIMVLLVLALLVGVAKSYKLSRNLGREDNFLHVARKMAQFEQTHPGRYAMGDRAGILVYHLESPVIQLEGLVMDKAFLEHIKNEDDLIDVMKQYRIDYYISTNPETRGDCYIFVEPRQADPEASPVMRGSICEKPIMEFHNSGVHTAVFRISQG